MFVKNLNDLYFSQSALVAYQSCPLKFRRRYLDGLFWPVDWGGDLEQRAAVELGRKFHLLAQRYYSRGEVFSPESEELTNWFADLRAFRPYHEQGKFLPEHELRVTENGLKLVAKYDLLYVTQDGKMIIYDWKTNATKPLSRYWRKHYQTIIYRYVFCKAGGIYSPKGLLSPEDVTMIYWNPRFPQMIEAIPYTQREFLRDEKLLAKIINQIINLDYANFLATGNQKSCGFCEYSPICHGKRAVQLVIEEEDMDFDLDWESIDQIQF